MRLMLTEGTLPRRDLFLVIQSHNEIELMDENGLMEYANNIYDMNKHEIEDLEKPNTVEASIYVITSVLEEVVLQMDDLDIQNDELIIKNISVES